MALSVGAVPSAASARPPTNLRVPALPVPRRYSNRGYPWVAWSAHGGGNGIWIAMLSPPMPTVGAGSSRFSRRFPRPPSHPPCEMPAHPRRVVIITEGFPGWLGMRMETERRAGIWIAMISSQCRL